MPARDNHVEEVVGGDAKDGGQSGKVALGAETIPKLIILKGTYGLNKSLEVTDVLQRLQEEAKGALKIDAKTDFNKLFTDPEPGKDKKLTLEYCYGDDGDVLSDVWQEKHDTIELPAEDKPTDPMVGTFTLTVHRCTDLKNVQTFGSMDPYVIVVSGKEQYKSKVHEKGHQTPTWDQSFLFNLNQKQNDPTLHIQVWDKNTLSDTQIGRLDIHPTKLSGTRDSQWFTLGSPADFNSQVGKLLVSCTWKGRGGNKPGKGDDIPVYIPDEQPAPTVVTVPITDAAAAAAADSKHSPAVVAAGANPAAPAPAPAPAPGPVVLVAVQTAVVAAVIDTTPIAKPQPPAPAPTPSLPIVSPPPVGVKPVQPPAPKPVAVVKPAVAVALPPNNPSCPKRHPMTLYDGKGPSNYRSTGFRCDKCAVITKFADGKFYHCDRCKNYDMCVGCANSVVSAVIASGGISAPACARGHGTTEYTGHKPSHPGYASAKSFNCDVCSRGYNFTNQLTLFHCDTCKNWDMCLPCANRARKLKPAIIVGAPGAQVSVRVVNDAGAAGAGAGVHAPLCKKGHHMSPYVNRKPANYGGTGFNCDVCSKGHKFTEPVANYHCDVCTNYDCCNKCATAFLANAN